MLELILAHIADAVGHPFHDGLAASGEVARSSARHDEEIREPDALEAHIVARTPGIFVFYRLTAFSANIYPGLRPGPRVISRRKDDDVQFVLGAAGLDALGDDAFDRRLAHVNQ